MLASKSENIRNLFLGLFIRISAADRPSLVVNAQHLRLCFRPSHAIKIGAKVVSHGRYVMFQMAEVAIARQMFQEILRLIAELRPQPPPAPA